LLQGFGLGASLIVAIGAQNAFVLRQGLKRQYLLVVALTCTIIDAVLILIGVAGLGTLISSTPILTAIALWGGAAFLLFYGFRSFRSAANAGSLKANGEAAKPSDLRATILTTLALSLLNPHVYLDTVVIIGSVGAKYPFGTRLSFAVGAMLASAVWFFTLTYGAARLAPLFRSPQVWRILDILVGCVMWLIAASLIWEAFSK
jgi:L-lysine exporter family protein LysE/ArgO